MLLQLHPDKVSKMWDEIKPAIYESLSPVTGAREEIMNNILTAVLTEELSCWMSYQVVDGINVMDSFITTMFVYDAISGERNLLIYTLYGYMHIPDESYSEGLEALIKYGRKHGCYNILLYTNNENILKQVSKLTTNIFTTAVIPLGG